MSAAPKVKPVRLCRRCELPAETDSLDCASCTAERERKMYARLHRMSEDDRQPDDANSPECQPDGMGRHGWRR